MGRLVMGIHREDIEGFSALLNKVMWQANYYRTEYAVHARGLGHDLVGVLHGKGSSAKSAV